MAAFSCPYCSHALPSADDAKLERCPSCDGTLLIAYRHRLLSSHGKVSGGELYQAIDDGFGERVAVLFVEDPRDAAAVERFIEGSRLFADLGGRGLAKILDVGTHSDRRAYVVMDWIEGGTLDVLVENHGALGQAALLELVGDLLTGVSKAHRSMPAIVHGHIHPGKIGFRSKGAGVVLFGFEWATQINAQASHLADSFSSSSATEEPRGPVSDLRQLGAVFYYAATAEWLGDQKLERQRERARGQLSGPLGSLVDRMLGAGLDGYKSAVDAAIDFEQLLRGIDGWQAPTKPRHDHSADRMGTAWAIESPHDHEEHDDEHEGDDEEEHDENPFAVPPAVPQPSVPSPPNWATIEAQRQVLARAQAQAKPANPGRAVLLSLAFMMVVGTCVAGMIVGESDQAAPQVQVREQPAQAIPSQPIPDPYPMPAIPEPPVAEPPVELPPKLAGLFRYKGKITGPEEFAGLELGERCEVWIAPNEGSLNCRWYIDCGKPKRRIYGGGEVGYSTCELDDQGHPLRAQDEDDDAPDGAFLADFTTDPKMIILEDRWIEPPVRVIISIDEGDLHEGEVPEVKHAPRDSQERVQERIDAGESPVIKAGVIGKW
jgi:serine/threonine protein kinase